MKEEVAFRTVKNRMNVVESLVHLVLIVLTCGFWAPVYIVRKKNIERTTTTYRVREENDAPVR